MAFNPQEFNPNNRPIAYQQYAGAFHSIVTHTRGYNVGRFLRMRRPNEPDEFYTHRMLNYQALTLGSWLRIEDKASRILTAPKFRYSTSEYLYDSVIEAKDENGLPYFQWVSQIFMRRMLEDANGYKIWIPVGQGLTNPAKKIQLKRYLVCSIYMVEEPHENDYDRIVFCMPEAIHYWGKRNENREMTYWAIDREWYWKITRQGDNGKWVAEQYYRHALGELPITKIPGIYTSANNIANWSTAQNNFMANDGKSWPYVDEKTWAYDTRFANYVDFKQSFFSGFVPSANTALVHFADAEAANLSCAYPIRIEEWTPCPVKECGLVQRGMVLGDDGTLHKCTTCNGDGVLFPNPLGRYVRRRMPAGIDGQETVTDPITLIPGEAEAVKVLYQQAFDFLKRAEADVWLKDVDKVMSNEQVDVGNEGSKNHIRKIGNAVYSFMESDLYYAEALTHGSSAFEAPVIETPVDYEVREEGEILETMIKLSSSDVPTAVKIKYEKDIARMQANGKDDPIRIIDLKTMWDVLYGKSDTEVSTAVGIGGLRPEIVAKHYAVDSIIARIIAREGIEFIYPNESETQQQADARIMLAMDTEFASMGLINPEPVIV